MYPMLFPAFPQMCVTAIANLQQESAKAGANKLLFSKDREIIPFIDQYWEAMTTMPRRFITLSIAHTFVCIYASNKKSSILLYARAADWIRTNTSI